MKRVPEPFDKGGAVGCQASQTPTEINDGFDHDLVLGIVSTWSQGIPEASVILGDEVSGSIVGGLELPLSGAMGAPIKRGFTGAGRNHESVRSIDDVGLRKLRLSCC